MLEKASIHSYWVGVDVTLLVGIEVPTRVGFSVGVVVGVEEAVGVKVTVGVGVKAAICAMATSRHSSGTESSAKFNIASQTGAAALSRFPASIVIARQ